MISGLALLTVLLAFTALTRTDVVAQIRAALVKNTDERGRMPYRDVREFGTYTCYSANMCIVAFNPVPAGKRLVLEHVSMMVAAVSGARPRFLALGDCISLNSCNEQILSPDFVQVPFSSEFAFWVIDRPVHAYYEPGSTPKLKFSVNGDGMGGAGHNATLHGYLIDATN